MLFVMFFDAASSAEANVKQIPDNNEMITRILIIFLDNFTFIFAPLNHTITF